MDFAELLSDFAKRHGIDNLASEDNAAALDIDGIVVTLVAASDTLAVTAEIGEPPAEGAAAFADLLLEASLESDTFFAKNRDTGNYIVVRRLSLPALDAAAFDSALEELVNLAETWRRLLADFRPAAKAAAEASAAAPSFDAFGANGFMQV